jgi:hypothetical protein
MYNNLKKRKSVMEYGALVIWSATALFAIGSGYILYKNRDIFTYNPK